MGRARGRNAKARPVGRAFEKLCRGRLPFAVAARGHRLERHAHMRLAIGFALLDAQTAEPEVIGGRVAHRPFASLLGQFHQVQALGAFFHFADLGQGLGADFVGRGLRGQGLACRNDRLARGRCGFGVRCRSFFRLRCRFGGLFRGSLGLGRYLRLGGCLGRCLVASRGFAATARAVG